MKVNRRNLATPETYSKFVYAKNVLDYERVLTLAQEGHVVRIDERKSFFMATDDRGITKRGCIVALEPPNLGEIVENGICYQITDSVYPYAATKAATLVPCKTGGNEADVLRFIAIGRLSPEKNYNNLIDAFHKFCGMGYNAMLYILGDGPKKRELEKKISLFGMSSRIILMGNVPNPFGLMRNCDCFILPSLHEGQPMVILEARVMKKPIIMTEFSSADGSMLPNGQYIVEKTADGICKGLIAFANGEVPCDYCFDGQEYNEEAYNEFLCAIGEREYGGV